MYIKNAVTSNFLVNYHYITASYVLIDRTITIPH